MKKRKLLFQIGVLVTFLFVLFLLVSELYLLKKSSDLFLLAKNEMIEKNLYFSEKNLSVYICDECIDYTIRHMDELDMNIYSEENFKKTIDIEKSFGDKNLDQGEYFLSLNDKEKEIYCLTVRDYIFGCLNTFQLTEDYVGIMCFVPLDDNNIMVLAQSGSELNESKNSESDEEYTDARDIYGKTFSYDSDILKGLKTAINKKSKKALFFKEEMSKDMAFYSGYLPVYDKDGDFLYVLQAEYDWSDVYSDISYSLRGSMTRDFVIAIIIAVTLILVSIYFVALRPLRKVKDTLDVYMENKDSEEVEKRLSNFKTKNEIGTLADGVLDFSREIEQYTEDNIRLATETAKVQAELDLAGNIQEQSLIKDFPKSDNYEVYASMTPAKTVGGDFYDVFDIDEDHTCFVIADVSGKGMPAALFMMASMTTIRNYAMSGGKPSEILEKVNDNLCLRQITNMFVTVWLGILDKNTGVMTTSNAGHEFPAVNKNGSYELFKDKHGLVIGGMEGMKYRDETIELSKGDRVFVYTDGVPEATNAEEKMYGTDRMIAALNRNPAAAPQQLLKNIKDDVDEFVGEAEQFDDLTMMCIIYR